MGITKCLERDRFCCWRSRDLSAYRKTLRALGTNRHGAPFTSPLGRAFAVEHLEQEQRHGYLAGAWFARSSGQGHARFSQALLNSRL